MKKLMLLAAVAVFGVSNLQAQEGFTLGAHIGIPLGDVADVSTLNFGFDGTYLFNVGEGFDAGVTGSYSSFSSGDQQTVSGGNVTVNATSASYSLFAIAASARYSFAEHIFGGADVGYGFGSYSTSGLYYQPKAGYQTEKIDIYAYYKGLSADGVNISAAGVGFGYRF